MDVGDATRTGLSRPLLHYLRRCRVTLHYVISKTDATAEGVTPDVDMSPSPPSTLFLVWMSGNRRRVDSTGGLRTDMFCHCGQCPHLLNVLSYFPPCYYCVDAQKIQMRCLDFSLHGDNIGVATAQQRVSHSFFNFPTFRTTPPAVRSASHVSTSYQ